MQRLRHHLVIFRYCHADSGYYITIISTIIQQSIQLLLMSGGRIWAQIYLPHSNLQVVILH